MPHTKISITKNITEIKIYDHILPTQKARRKKVNKSTEIRMRTNYRKTVNSLCLKAENNFTREKTAWFLLSFCKSRTIPTTAKTRKDLRAFLKKLRRALPCVKYIAVVHVGAKKKRPHVHILIDTKDLKTIKTCWSWGHVSIRYIYCSSKSNSSSMSNVIRYMLHSAISAPNKSLAITSNNLEPPRVFHLEGTGYERFTLDFGAEIAYESNSRIEYYEGYSSFCGNFKALTVDTDNYKDKAKDYHLLLPQ